MAFIEQLDIFSYQPPAQDTDTSRAAAAEVQPRAVTLRLKALAVIRSCPSTADQVAAVLQETVLTIRPRIAELNKLGEIVDSGERRANSSGRQAIVWRAA